MGLLNIRQCVREMTCGHYSTATKIEAYSDPHPHVISRTVCLDCGKAVAPARRVTTEVVHRMLEEAATKARTT